jgi:hypothetical protein
MKKLLIVLLSIALLPAAYAYNPADAANIKIKVSGATTDNRYFLCVRGIGCLSMLAAKKGKVFPFLRDVEMNSMYVLDTKSKLRLSPQGLPRSCNVTVKEKQTLTISANLVNKASGIQLNQLRCSVS